MNKVTSLMGCDLGDKLVLPESRGWSQAPHVEYSVLVVTKRTSTRLEAVPDGKSARWAGNTYKARLADGKVVGETYTYLSPATPEILQLVAEQRAMRDRYRTAVAAVDDLIDVPLHRLKLTVPQLEKLAQAWGEVKAMAAPTETAKQED